MQILCSPPSCLINFALCWTLIKGWAEKWQKNCCSRPVSSSLLQCLASSLLSWDLQYCLGSHSMPLHTSFIRVFQMSQDWRWGHNLEVPHLVFSPAPVCLIHRHAAGCQSRWDWALWSSGCHSAHLKAFILLHQLLLGEQVLGLDVLQTGRPLFTLSGTNTKQGGSDKYYVIM